MENYVTAIAEFVCIPFLIVMLISMWLKRYKMAHNVRLFTEIIAFTVAGTALDTLSYFDGITKHFPAFFVRFIHLTGHVFPLVSATLFAYYLYELLEEKGVKDKLFPRIVFAMSVFDLITIVYGTMTKQLFIYEDGVYSSGSISFLCRLMRLFVYLFTIATVYLKRQSFIKAEFNSILIYQLILCVNFIPWLFDAEHSDNYIAPSLAILVLYIMVQSTDTTELKMEQQMAKQLQNNDVLTGVKNRPAFMKDMKKLMEEDVDVFLVYGKIQGLREVNHAKGLEVGDQMIQEFCSAMKKHLYSADLYRMEGNTFLAVQKVTHADENRLYFAQYDAFKEGLSHLRVGTQVEYSSGRTVEIFSMLDRLEYMF